MKKISVIIPIFNAEKTIYECIISILNQTYKDFELIMVDDGSTDNSRKICADLEKQDKRIRLFCKKNGGVSSSRNFGIKKATGDYIFFIDADDWLEEDALEKLVKIKNQNNLPCLKQKNVYINKIITVNFEKKYKKDDYIIDIIKGKYNGVIWGYLLDSNIVKKILFDEKTYFLEDTIFLFQYLDHSSASEIEFVDSYYNYRYVESSITNNNSKIFDKCEKILYSLDTVNSNTDNKYFDIISDKKVIIIEKQLRFLSKKDDFEKAVNEIRIPIYKQKNIFLKIYSRMYNKKNINYLIMHYKIRAILKFFKNKI